MPAISRRRGTAAILVRGFGEGLAFCSGGNFSTGSAIVLFLPRRLLRRILYSVAHVFLDRLQLGEQTVGVCGIDALERGRGQLRAESAQLAEQRTRSLAQIKPIDAAVGIVAAAFDPAVVAEPVDPSRQRDRLDFH